jgi:hypothetical protein
MEERMARTITPTPALSAAQIEDFWSKVDKSDGCWTWTGYVTDTGYGRPRYRVDGKQYFLRAHRLAYEFLIGPIPDGLILDHTCHQRACVNPDHLRPVTDKQNIENLSGAQARNISGVRGVTWYKRTGQWRASVNTGGKAVHVGYYSDIKDAEQAVTAKRLEVFTHNDLDRIA